MSELSRSGMSDAHLRADLRAQNPLYGLAGSATARFEQERCSYHAMALADLDKTEAERRRVNLANGKRYFQREQGSDGNQTGGSEMIESTAPMPAPRPSGWVRYWVDRAMHRERMKRDHAQATGEQELSPKDAFKISRMSPVLDREHTRSR